jgi:hypothetical protein
MGTRDVSETLKATMARGREARRRGKQRVLEDEKDSEEDGTERRGKTRLREAAVMTVEAIAMGRRCRSGAFALRRRQARRGARQVCGEVAGGGAEDGQVMNYRDIKVVLVGK